MIKKCICDNKGQDQLHGFGNRVCNKNKDGGYRCTVCCRIVNSLDLSKKKTKKDKEQ